MATGYLPAIPVPEEQQAAFQAQMMLVAKDEVVGVLLALFLGAFGAHHFYLRRNGLGVTYLLLCWTGIPALLGLVECFFMPGRVASYNRAQATLLAQSFRNAGAFQPMSAGAMVPLPGPGPSLGRSCASCGTPLGPTARFCARCGTAVAV